ncbi:MAG TPA: hypothetical protein VJR29_12845 [bacterium]|nr:hypothetical protein [bacterium]
MTELLEHTWGRLEAIDDQERMADAKLLEEFFQGGFIDARRFGLNQWKQACQKFAKGPKFVFKKADWEGLKSFFFGAEIKRPFDPKRLNDGMRPLDWTSELYQKVFRFETTMTLEEWKKIVQTQILTRFKKGNELVYNAAFKALLEGLLKQKASPLRRLELWYHFERSKEGPPAAVQAGAKAESEGKRTPSSPVIRDAFVAKPEESVRRGAIDKLYFHQGEQPKATDDESLDFLDELAKLGDDENSPLK